MRREIGEQPEVLARLLATCGTQARDLRAALDGRRRIILAGMGASLHALGQARPWLWHCGLHTDLLSTAELPSTLACCDGRDLVILASQSGASLETVEVLPTLRQRGVPCWGITNQADSPLARGANRVIALAAGAEVSSATKTCTATLLIAWLMGGDAAPFAGMADAAAAVLAEPEPRLPGVEASPLCFLGLGSQDHTAALGALLWEEKTLLSAQGMAVSDYRHGHVETLGPGTRLVLIAPQGLAGEAARHTAFFAARGAVVTVLAPEPVVGASHLAIPPIPDRLAHLPATILLQLLAESEARRLGRDIDAFRHIGKVVADY